MRFLIVPVAPEKDCGLPSNVRPVLVHSENPVPLDRVRDVGLRLENAFEIAVAMP